MPSLADSMTEGTIVRWLKHDGDAIRPGDELAEIETEKATVSIAAEAEGYLQVTCPEGETVAVGSVIARIDRDRTEGQKVQEETRKFVTEQHTLMAEARKFGRDPYFLLIGALIAAVATRLPEILRAFGVES